MHDIKLIEEDVLKFKENILKRGDFDSAVIDSVVELNSLRKELTKFVEERRADIKSKSKEVGVLKKSGGDAADLMKQVAELKAEIEAKNNQLDETNHKLRDMLSVIPNRIDDEVPFGKTEDDNQEVSTWGTPREFTFSPKEHTVLGENLQMLDFERAAKLAGSRFVVYKSDLAKLERALINFMIDTHVDNGYVEFIPPYIVNSETLYGTGQLPKFGEDLFKLEGKDWYLIPTAEVPLTNFKSKELFPMEDLPLKYCAYTPCFRSEAGSYGKDTKGLIRLHQFNKVEMVNIVHPEESKKSHQEMIASAKSVLEKLDLPYRELLLCSADIGFGARRCIDLEVWLPGQNKYREISSISNCGDFQSRRASIRFRGKDNKPQFAHTLNGSGLAVGRTLVAILENYQNEDGSVKVPEILVPYMRGQTTICQK